MDLEWLLSITSPLLCRTVTVTDTYFDDSFVKMSRRKSAKESVAFQGSKHFRWRITTPKTAPRLAMPRRIYNSAAVQVGGIVVVIARHERDWPSIRVVFYNTKQNAWSIVHNNGASTPGRQILPPVLGLVNGNVFLLDSRLPVVHYFDLVLRDWIPLEVKGVTWETRTGVPGFMESIHSFIYWDFAKGQALSVLDLETLEWSEQSTKGELPSNVRGSRSTCNKGNTIFFAWKDLVGKTVLYLLSTNTTRFYWSKPRIGGFRPRYNSGATLTYSAGRLFSFGSNVAFGRNSLDVYIIEKEEWHKVSESDTSAEYTVQGTSPSAKSHSTVALGDKLITFGGFSLTFQSCRILEARTMQMSSVL